MKRLLSAPADRFVQKYALHAESYPRRAVAVATTNEATYWQDSTGARRLVPIKCGAIGVDMIAANRLQWFAEARACDEAAPGGSFRRRSRTSRKNGNRSTRGRRRFGRAGSTAGMAPSWPDGWIASAVDHA